MNDSTLFDQVQQEATKLGLLTRFKYSFTYSISVAVKNNDSKTVSLQIEQDADFFIQNITGSIIAPADVNGLRLPAQTSDFPLAGAVNAAGALIGFADHGLSVKITDTGAGRTLTNGYIPLELILTPGYREQFDKPYEFKYYADRNSKLKFEFMNRDTKANVGVQAYHYVTIALKGYKLTPPPLKAS
jgi:hypothetical protein